MNKQGFSTNIILVAVVIVLAGVVIYLSLPSQLSSPTPPPSGGSPVAPAPATTITPPPTSGLQRYADSYTTYGQHFSPEYRIFYEFFYPSSDFTVETSANKQPPIILKESNGKTHSILIGINLEAFGGTFRQYFEAFAGACSDCQEVQNNINIANATEVYTFANNTREYIGFVSPKTGIVIAVLEKPTDKAKRVLESLSVTTTIVNR